MEGSSGVVTPVGDVRRHYHSSDRSSERNASMEVAEHSGSKPIVIRAQPASSVIHSGAA